jgi:hypothetical protein
MLKDLAIDGEEVYIPFQILELVGTYSNHFFDNERTQTQLLKLWVFSFVFMQLVPFEDQVTNMKVFFTRNVFIKPMFNSLLLSFKFYSIFGTILL